MPEATDGRPLRVSYSAPPDTMLASIWNHIPHDRATTPGSADYVLFPKLIWGINDLATIRAMVAPDYESAVRSGRRLLVFLCLDTSASLDDLPQALLFRTSIERSHRAGNEHPLPYGWDCRNEAFPPCTTSEEPAVSFCGFAASHPIRQTALRYLQQSGVRTDFIIREAFWGGKPHDPGLVAEFWANLERSPFAFACRGAGNFSIRFFQALSAGRIPVTVDTDLALPCAAQIDWAQTVVLAPSAEAVPASLRHFAATHDLVVAQRECRRVFDAYLSQTGFARWLGQRFRQERSQVATVGI